MTGKQQSQLTIALVVFQLIFWPLVFFPQLQRFLSTFDRDVSTSSEVVPRQRTSSGMIQRIDYDTLRNIFEYASHTTPTPSPAAPRPPASPRYTPPPASASPERVNLQLRSILTLQGKMIATLQDAMVPERMFTVVKGDVIEGYRVVEVTSDAIVLEKHNQQIRLTLE